MSNIFFDVTKQYCSSHYQTILTSDADKETAINEDFILKYNIDMSIFNRTNYLDYNSANDWLTRTLAPGFRPIAAINDSTVLTSPADSRVMVFRQVPRDSTIWIKNEQFSMKTLVGDDSYVSSYEDGSLGMIRLAPQDYHRFHSPIDGVIVNIAELEGTLHSVSADGMTSGNDAQYNQRTVISLQTKNFGRMAYVAIGAACVGSVVITKLNSSSVAKGEELGYFQFGGSTVALVLQKGSIVWDEDLLYHSANRVETLLNMGTRLGWSTNQTVIY